MRIAVCDTNLSDRETTRSLLHRYCAGVPLTPMMTVYQNARNLLYDMAEGAHFDVIFLDIYMRSLLGMDVARTLRADGYRGEIVFLTASMEFALEGYDVGAAAYLLKPHNYERLSAVMDRILRRFGTDSYRFRHRSRIVSLLHTDIAYIESRNAKCLLHAVNGEEYTVYQRLSDIEAALNDRRFLRCHQSYLVNMDHICRADTQFTLDTGDSVLIRRRDNRALREAYAAYIAEKDLARR